MKKNILLCLFIIFCFLVFDLKVGAVTYKCYKCGYENNYSYKWIYTSPGAKCTLVNRTESQCNGQYVDGKNTNTRSTDAIKTGTVDFNNTFDKFDSGFGDESMSCSELLGPTLVKFLKIVRYTIQGLGAAISIVSGMMSFIPAITSKDSDALKKAFDKFVKILIILAFLLLLPTLVRLIGRIVGFDLSCI